MKSIFPEPISALPRADIPLDGIKAYMSQSDTHQIVFMEFEKDVELPEHFHEAQAGFVVQGKIRLTIAGEEHLYTKGDMYFIPAGVRHSGRIYAGYADITFFNEKNRYKTISTPQGR